MLLLGTKSKNEPKGWSALHLFQMQHKQTLIIISEVISLYTFLTTLKFIMVNLHCLQYAVKVLVISQGTLLKCASNGRAISMLVCRK